MWCIGSRCIDWCYELFLWCRLQFWEILKGKLKKFIVGLNLVWKAFKIVQLKIWGGCLEKFMLQALSFSSILLFSCTRKKSTCLVYRWDSVTWSFINVALVIVKRLNVHSCMYSNVPSTLTAYKPYPPIIEEVSWGKSSAWAFDTGKYD